MENALQNSDPILEVIDLHAGYGKSHILQGVSLRVGAEEVVSLLGRNGVGRSTTAKAIMGEVQPHGSVRFRGREIGGLKPHQIARLGIGYVPESRDIFPTLTVRENLLLGRIERARAARWSMEEVFEAFPRLRERAETPGGALSGGEQQLLSICRALIGGPDLLIVDEPTEGLAPMMIDLVGELLRKIASRSVSILLIEQKLSIALKISHRVCVMGHGRVVYEGTPRTFIGDDAIRKEWLEV